MDTIGLCLEKESFRIAILKKEKNRIVVDSLQAFPFGPESVKLFYNLPPFHAGQEGTVASGLSGSDIFIRKLNLPLREKKKILAALPFQLESLLPYAEEEPVICPLLKPLGKKMTIVTVIASSKTRLAAHIDILKEIDIKPDVVSCHPVALARFARWKFPEEYRILCFDVRDQNVSCVVLEGDELIISQTVNMADIEKLSIFLKQKGAIDDETPWMLSDKALSDSVGRIFPGRQLAVDQPDHAAYAIPIGLALDAMLADGSNVNFRQKEFTPAHTFHARKKKILQYAAFCGAAALLMWVGGSLAIKKKETLLKETLQEHLSSSPLKDSLFSASQIETKLREWESSLKGQKSSFPLLPNVPKLSDVLAWLSMHPTLANEEGGQKEGIEIKSLHYTLLKYPKIGDTSSPYLGQVEIEFRSEAPRSARDFHEALLKGDQIVNAKKEVKWRAQNQTYYTSFELNAGIP